MNNFFKINLIIFASVFLLGSSSVFASNNSISFETPGVIIAPQSDFPVSVFINTEDPINAFDLEIVYPKDKLQLLNFDNNHSIVDIWQTVPALLSNGNIHLIGGIVKSFKGEKGLLIKINFRTLTEGEDTLSFAKNNLYIADGKATDAEVLSNSSNISVKNDGSLLKLETSIPDTTPPSILLKEIKDSLGNSPLITFEVSDSDYGIKKTEMRYKQLFAFSSWENVKNPVLHPYGAWLIEFRTYSNGGAYNTQVIFSKIEIVKKITLIFLFLLAVIFIIYRSFIKKV